MTAPTTERPVELGYGEYTGNDPDGGGPVERWEHLEFDNATCSRSHLCPSYDRRGGTARVIGGYIGSTSDGLYPAFKWDPPWYFPSAPGMAICEDCADLVADIDYDDSLFAGSIADATWFIDRAPADSDDAGKFYAWVGWFAMDGGLDAEIELGVHDTVGAARTAIAIWGGERNRDLDAEEAKLDAVLAEFDG